MNAERDNNTPGAPLKCPMHTKLLEDVHLAVCGDENIGVNGLVKDMADLKRWRTKLDLRIAAVAGGVSVAFWIFEKILWK